MKVNDRLYINFGSAMKVSGVFERNWRISGHKPKFGRSWWYWRPYFHWTGNPFRGRFVDFGASWLCWFFFVNWYPRRVAVAMTQNCAQSEKK